MAKKRAGTWFGEKVKLDGYTFDSQKEAAFYKRFIKDSGYKFDVHKSFHLHPIIDMCGGVLRLRSSNYTPDFVLYNEDGSIAHVVDVKNSFNTTYAIDAAASLRFKMFAYNYGMPVEVVVPRVKSFRVKVLGTTKKFEPVSKDNFDYSVQDLVTEAMNIDKDD